MDLHPTTKLVSAGVGTYVDETTLKKQEKKMLRELLSHPWEIQKEKGYVEAYLLSGDTLRAYMPVEALQKLEDLAKALRDDEGVVPYDGYYILCDLQKEVTKSETLTALGVIPSA